MEYEIVWPAVIHIINILFFFVICWSSLVYIIIDLQY